MLEQDDFKIRDKHQGKPVKIGLAARLIAFFGRRLLPKPKPAIMRMPDLRIQNNQYGDTEIKTKPWGRVVGMDWGVKEGSTCVFVIRLPEPGVVDEQGNVYTQECIDDMRRQIVEGLPKITVQIQYVD